jgi:hypothetical protein
MTPRPYALFYHIWCPAGTDIWRLLVDEQLKRIRRSGLPFHADIFCCITGPQHAAIRQYVAAYDWITILRATADESRFEGETLGQISLACTVRSDLRGVGYIHTKGIAHYPTATPHSLRAINSWRHFLEWGTIDRWRDALARLQAADVVGVNFKSSPWPHFSGNFWWARPGYIQTLVWPEVPTLPVDYTVVQDAGVAERLAYERWIGMNNPVVFSFCDQPFMIPGHDPAFGSNLYADDIFPFCEQNGI